LKQSAPVFATLVTRISHPDATMRDSSLRVRRRISFRKATPNEAAILFENI
jgi:hypothetical protein